MHAERDELIKRVFPQLRKLCEERGVTWSEIDLRWGITDEQRAEGEVLPICLEEIRRCRPYFIGLLGERYGTLPREIPEELMERQPWLREHQERSVTELEIVHGVLRESNMHGHGYFYFRDPSYVDHLPSGANRRDFEPESDAARRKLASLKQRIRQAHEQAICELREDYRDAQKLGRWVIEDFAALIDRLFPEEQEPTPLDREAADHEAFALSRTRVYISRQAYIDRLDAHAAGDGLPLVALGKSGSGKSALLANWALRYREQHPDQLLIMHFIGASPYSGDWAAMLRRILGEFNRRLGLHTEIPDEPEKLRRVFANALHMAAARGRIILVLDALNQLEDRDGAPDLVWLPSAIPANVRLLLSTLPGRPLDELSRRDWPTLHIEPLNVEERQRLIEDYLRQYTKGLSPARTRRIADAPQSANPRYLRALLEELRVFGVHEQLDERIGHYLGAETAPDLYERILERYEEDYDRDRPGLIRDTMILLRAARRGLSESELLDLLGTPGQPLPTAYWSPLYLAAEQSLVSRGGFIGFSHDDLREAVRRRYVPTASDEQASHLRLADYFSTQDLGRRKVDELPWQLAEGRAWNRLGDLLAQPEFLAAAWARDMFDVRAHWARVEANSDVQMLDACTPMLEAIEATGTTLEARSAWALGNLLERAGHWEEALRLWSCLTDHYRQSGNLQGLSSALGNQAVVLRMLGSFDEAAELHQEEEDLCRQLGDKKGLQSSLGNQAVVLLDQDRFEEAMVMLKEQEQLCRELDDQEGLQSSLGNQGVILLEQKRPDQAMKLLREQEHICRGSGNLEGLQGCLGNQAWVRMARDQMTEAMALFKGQESICRTIDSKIGFVRALAGRAILLEKSGDLQGAIALLEEQEAICRKIGDVDGVLFAGSRLAEVLQRLHRKPGQDRETLPANIRQAVASKDDKHSKEALEQLREQERENREAGDKAALETCLGAQAMILLAQGELNTALTLLKEKTKLGNELQRDADSIPMGLQATGRLDDTRELLRELEHHSREAGELAVLQSALAMLADLLFDVGEFDEVLDLCRERERICRQLGDRRGLGAALMVQGSTLWHSSQYEEALSCFQKAELVVREAEEFEYLVAVLMNQSTLLAHYLDRPREALPLIEEAYDLVISHGLTKRVDSVRDERDQVRAMLEE
jgi:tetratricopeptide (TPR) repeat protein